MKFKNIEVGMKLQNKNTGKIYTVVRDMYKEYRLDDYYNNVDIHEEYQLDDYYNDVDNLKTNIISKYYNDAKLFRKVKDEA